jgi:asparagine synthase (glutamine-hydrolysing)
LAEAAGAAIEFPFLDRRFLAVLAHTGGALGSGDATQVMRAHFGSLLPDDILTRTDKAGFDAAYWGPYSRRFIATWAEHPVLTDFVDEVGLRETWHESTPHAASSTVLQALWLKTGAGRPPLEIGDSP